MSEDKNKQIDRAIGIVARLAGNSFAIKGWSIALATGTLAYVSKDGVTGAAWIALIPVITLGLLDCYYLTLERRARGRYKALVKSSELDYDLTPVREDGDFLKALRSPAIWLFHVPLLLLVLLVATVGPGIRAAPEPATPEIAIK